MAYNKQPITIDGLSFKVNFLQNRLISITHHIIKKNGDITHKFEKMDSIVGRKHSEEKGQWKFLDLTQDEFLRLLK